MGLSRLVLLLVYIHIVSRISICARGSSWVLLWRGVVVLIARRTKNRLWIWKLIVWRLPRYELRSFNVSRGVIRILLLLFLDLLGGILVRRTWEIIDLILVLLDWLPVTVLIHIRAVPIVFHILLRFLLLLRNGPVALRCGIIRIL